MGDFVPMALTSNDFYDNTSIYRIMWGFCILLSVYSVSKSFFAVFLYRNENLGIILSFQISVLF